tara:strand:+ start:311 stop:655 length:345 start_codon:yes stop_codon:yes gene_type:complete
MHTFILSSDVPSAFSNQSVSIGSSKPLNVEHSLASVPVLAIISYDVWRINFSLVDYTSGKGGLDHTTRILSLYCRSGEKLGAGSGGRHSKVWGEFASNLHEGSMSLNFHLSANL